MKNVRHCGQERITIKQMKLSCHGCEDTGMSELTDVTANTTRPLVLDKLLPTLPPKRSKIKLSAGEAFTQQYNQISLMNSSTPWLKVVHQKYKEYQQKVSLTAEAKAKVSHILNDLHLLALIYTSTNEDNRAIIDKKLEEVDRALGERIKGQGWMSYFSKSSEAVTMDEVWKCVNRFVGEGRQQLIDDICTVKGLREVKEAH